MFSIKYVCIVWHSELLLPVREWWESSPNPCSHTPTLQADLFMNDRPAVFLHSRRCTPPNPIPSGKVLVVMNHDL